MEPKEGYIIADDGFGNLHYQIEDNPNEASVKITFPAGPHTTGLACQYIRVDGEQCLIAGTFLIRQSDELARLSTQQAQQRKIIPARILPGGSN